MILIIILIKSLTKLLIFVAYNTSFLDFVNSKYVMDEKGLTDFKKNRFGVWGAMGNFGFITKR